MDNIFVERLWRSLKYEEVYLNAYESVAEAKAGDWCLAQLLQPHFITTHLDSSGPCRPY
jgi:hypothetical protein